MKPPHAEHSLKGKVQRPQWLRKLPPILIAALIALLLTPAILLDRRSENQGEQTPHFPQDVSSTHPATEDYPVSPSRPEPNATSASFKDLLESIRGASPEQAKEILDGWREHLLGLGPQEAVAEIETFLASGEDAQTGLPFRLREGGFLEYWPSVRVAALDFLGEVDAREAAAIGRDILGHRTTAGEWAIALRNVARIEGASSFLREKTQEMVGDVDWRRKGETAYLEAFDFVVLAEDASMVPILSEILESPLANDDPSQFAAFLAIDRLAMRSPGVLADLIRSHGNFLTESPALRPQIFARADPTDAEQRGGLEDYLLAPSVPGREKGLFLASYPNHNLYHSFNLATVTQGIPVREMARRDAAAVDWLYQLSARSDLDEGLRQALDRRIHQLQTHLSQARESGFHNPKPSP